jgi:long-chain fatty acid transport protein
MRGMDMPSRLGIRPLWEQESPTQRLDRLAHSSVSPLAGGLSPVSLALAWADWAWHLAVSPGRQMDLGALAMRHAQVTWRVALGGAYKYSDQWKVKFGTAYDESPVSDQFRLPRLPDNNRIWLSIGGQYKPNKDSALDFGYSYIFVDDAPISTDPANAASKGIVRGEYDNDVNILAVQYSMSF